MELTLQRIAKDKAYTLGELSIDGEKFCHTLEPRWREPEARRKHGKWQARPLSLQGVIRW